METKILSGITDGSLSLGTVGFLHYLQSVFGHDFQATLEQIVAELPISKKIARNYIRELEQSAILQVDYVSGDGSRYRIGQEFTHAHTGSASPTGRGTLLDSINSISKKSKTPTPTGRGSHTGRGKKLTIEKPSGDQDKYSESVTAVVTEINAILPVKHQILGDVPKKYRKKLLVLAAQVNVTDYTRWYLQSKIENPLKPTIQTLELGLFVFESMVREFMLLEPDIKRQDMDKKSTSKWKDYDFSESKQKLLERMNRAKG
jgi:hypothetical protein